KSPTRRVTSKQESDVVRECLRLQRWLEKAVDDERSAADEEQEVSFSREMWTRMDDAMHATLGSGLWRDVVASRIAAEMTSETVFGGAVSTRRPECPIDPAPQWTAPESKSTATATATATPASTSTSIFPHPSESAPRDVSAPSQYVIQATAAVVALATEIREDAAHCVAVGRVADAIQTLQRGIDTLLYDATVAVHVEDAAVRTFDYSATAHALAIRIQKRYRARHHTRVRDAATIQRAWRRVWRHRRAQRQHTQRTASALRVQRFYRHARLDRSARIVQRCLRLFRRFKAFFRLRYAVVLVMQRERRRQAAVARRQQIRRRAKRKLQALLAFTDAVARQESARRHGEDAFVDARLAAATPSITAFVHETAAGDTLVRWRVAAPWIRWRRLRRRWRDVDRPRRVAAMCALLPEDESVWTASWTWLVVVAVLLSGTPNAKALVGLARRQRRQQANVRLVPSAEVVTTRLVQLETALAAVNARERTPVDGRWQQLRTRLRTNAADIVDLVLYAVLLVLWTCVWAPWLYVSTCVWTRSVRCQRSRSRVAAAVVHDLRRQLQSFLRHLFRRLERGNDPRFVCDWCGGTTALALEALAHRQHCDVHRQALSTEWTERERDVVDVWRHQWQWLLRPYKRDSTVVSPESLERRRFTRVQTLNRVPARHRRALELLVNAALCCGPESSTASTRLATELLALLTASTATAEVKIHPLLRDLELQVLPIWTVDAPPAPG
ncbi:hypothetical protein PINS_up017116, partial [Pythium insidiosum]